MHSKDKRSIGKSESEQPFAQLVQYEWKGLMK